MFSRQYGIIQFSSLHIPLGGLVGYAAQLRPIYTYTHTYDMDPPLLDQ